MRVCKFAVFAFFGTRFLLFALPPQRSEDALENPGFVHFYNNEFDEAIADFDQQSKANPADPYPYNYLAQAILYREMFRDGALESELVSGTNPFLRRAKMEISDEDKSRFTDSIQRSLGLADRALTQNPRDVYALYARAVAHGLRGNYLFLVEKAWVESLREATEARKADQQIVQIDPNFVDARLLLGLNEYIVGCLPFYWRALGFIGGFHGDKEGGIRELQLVADTGVMTRYDAQVLLAAIYRRERRARPAIPLLKSLAEKFPRNYLLRFEQVQMYSDLGDKNAALEVLTEVEALRRNGAPGYANLPPEKIEYARGNLLFWYDDLDSAITDLKQVTKKADELDLNTAVLAWLRLGQAYDLQLDHQDAVAAYRETMKIGPRSEEATEAKRYVSNPYRRKTR